MCVIDTVQSQTDNLIMIHTHSDIPLIVGSGTSTAGGLNVCRLVVTDACGLSGASGELIV